MIFFIVMVMQLAMVKVPQGFVHSQCIGWETTKQCPQTCRFAVYLSVLRGGEGGTENPGPVKFTSATLDSLCKNRKVKIYVQQTWCLRCLRFLWTPGTPNNIASIFHELEEITPCARTVPSRRGIQVGGHLHLSPI